MRELSRRGVRVLVVSGLQDSGLDVLEQHFGARASRLAALPGCTVQVVAGIDHGLTRSGMRAKVAANVADFVRAAFLPLPSAAPASMPVPQRRDASAMPAQ